MRGTLGPGLDGVALVGHGRRVRRGAVGRGLIGLGLVGLSLAACAVGTITEGDGSDGGVAAGPLDCSRPVGETAAGQCDGTVLSFCVNGELRTVDCGVVGAQCGLDQVTQVFACRQGVAPQPEPQPGGEPGVQPQPEPGPGPQPEPAPQPAPQPEADPEMPCTGLLDDTVCVGDLIIICRNEEAAGRTDCAMSGLTCGAVPSGGFGCVSGGGGGQPEPDPEPAAPMPPGGDGVCAGRDGGARCDGNIVVQCRGGQEDSRFDCTSNGQTCEIFDNTWAGCVGENQNPNVPDPDPEPQGEPCTAENFFGRCVGNVLEGCNLIEMEVFRLDCTILGATCGVMDGLYGCW